MRNPCRWLAMCVLTFACEDAPTLVLEEFPPPRLAKTRGLSSEAARYELGERSQARLRLRRGRRTSEWVAVGVTGWVELGSVGLTSSGRLTLSPDAPLPSGDAPASTPQEPAVAHDDPPDIGPVRIEWNVFDGDATDDSNSRVRTRLELNRHRSELPLALRRSRPNEGAAIRLVTTEPARIGLPDHGVQARFEAKHGEPLHATQLELQLDVELVHPE